MNSLKTALLITLLPLLLLSAGPVSACYDPGTQRWLNRDPVQEDDGVNLYTFLDNDPPESTDSYGLACEKKIYRVFKALQRQRKLVRQVNEISNRNAVKEIKQGLDQIKDGRRVVEVPSDEARAVVTKRLSPDGKMRGPERSRGGYPEHAHPNKGPYADVHIETRGAVAVVAVEEAVIPQSQRVSRTPGASGFDLGIAALWDLASAIDPFFLTDALEWAFKVRPEDFCDGN